MEEALPGVPNSDKLLDTGWSGESSNSAQTDGGTSSPWGKIAEHLANHWLLCASLLVGGGWHGGLERSRQTHFG